jgi:hypothetical protein
MHKRIAPPQRLRRYVEWVFGILRTLLGGSPPPSVGVSSVNPLFAIADKYYSSTDYGENNRKPDNFIELYHELLSGFRGVSINLLELGVCSGASTMMWHDYLPLANLVAIDIQAKPIALEAISAPGRVQFIQADQCDPAALQRAIAATNGEGFDVIIDDASHIGDYTRRSFDFLFPAALKPGGLYFIEDFHTGYMDTWADGRKFVDPAPGVGDEFPSLFPSHQYGMVGWLKQLFDELHTDLTASWLTPSGHRKYPMESFHVVPHLFVVKKSK